MGNLLLSMSDSCLCQWIDVHWERFVEGKSEANIEKVEPFKSVFFFYRIDEYFAESTEAYKSLAFSQVEALKAFDERNYSKIRQKSWFDSRVTGSIASSGLNFDSNAVCQPKLIFRSDGFLSTFELKPGDMGIVFQACLLIFLQSFVVICEHIFNLLFLLKNSSV